MDIAIEVAAVSEAWDQDSLSWPGPALIAGSEVTATLDDCDIDDQYPERMVSVSNEAVQAWIEDPTSNHGIVMTATAESAILALASSENNIVFVDSLGGISAVSGPRLQFQNGLLES